MITTNKEGLNHLAWIYGRLINVHNENPKIDYMLKLEEIIIKVDEMERENKNLKFQIEETKKQLDMSVEMINKILEVK